MPSPLWNNNMITGSEQKHFNIKVLKANGFHKLGQIVSDGHLKKVKEIAEQCSIKVSNAGKL